jgi:hypothetical protein
MSYILSAGVILLAISILLVIRPIKNFNNKVRIKESIKTFIILTCLLSGGFLGAFGSCLLLEPLIAKKHMLEQSDYLKMILMFMYVSELVAFYIIKNRMKIIDNK